MQCYGGYTSCYTDWDITEVPHATSLCQPDVSALFKCHVLGYWWNNDSLNHRKFKKKTCTRQLLDTQHALCMTNQWILLCSPACWGNVNLCLWIMLVATWAWDLCNRMACQCCLNSRQEFGCGRQQRQIWAFSLLVMGWAFNLSHRATYLLIFWLPYGNPLMD